MQDVVIAGYLRTANSKVKPSDPGADWFSALRADDLLAENAAPPKAPRSMISWSVRRWG